MEKCAVCKEQVWKNEKIYDVRKGFSVCEKCEPKIITTAPPLRERLAE